MEQTISVKALKSLISEGSNEFKAKIGPNVESEDKKNNGKAYSDAKKRAKDYDGGLSKEVGEEKAKFEKTDGNVAGIGSVVIQLGHVENVEELHAFLYPKDEYTVSATVRDIAGQVEQISGYTRAHYSAP